VNYLVNFPSLSYSFSCLFRIPFASVMSAAASSGFALRNNGSCLATEVDCGVTVVPYHACCPAQSFCPSQYNVDVGSNCWTFQRLGVKANLALQCCPTSTNCTSTLLKDPQCANETWDLYDNGGYFCCEKGFTGYAAVDGSDGCAEPGYAFKSGQARLPLVSAGQGNIFPLRVRLAKSDLTNAVI
jgi:hypothetical protein